MSFLAANEAGSRDGEFSGSQLLNKQIPGSHEQPNRLACIRLFGAASKQQDLVCRF